jgi:hypothetical protein
LEYEGGHGTTEEERHFSPWWHEPPVPSRRST